MNKRKIFFVLICGLVLGCLMAGAVMCIRKCTHKRKIGNQDAVYTYYGRTLSIKDFEQFDYNTTYEDMVMHLGEPNGWVGSGVVWPYYELADGRFAVCNCVRGGKMMQIAIFDRRNFEYKLLPLEPDALSMDTGPEDGIW